MPVNRATLLEWVKEYGSACQEYGRGLGVEYPTYITKEREVVLRNEAEQWLAKIAQECVPPHRSANPFDPGMPQGEECGQGERLSFEAAVHLLASGDPIPIRYGGLSGMAWSRSQALAAIREHGAYLAEESLTRAGYGLMLEDNQGLVWLGTRNKEVLPGSGVARKNGNL